ncbi:helix-turn-helix domain-containing protein [Streptomyces sp. NPDC046909]|uniref:PucR family transcriptional regulator n=1 Tax=Streptomyces sp. NPDC046909 TaxID=3155617 RepID=UPI0033ED37DE
MSLSAEARALAARCEGQVNALARRMAGGVFEQLRGYGELPADVKDVEIAATARQAMRMFLRNAAQGVVAGPLDDGGLGLFQKRAVQRAEEGMPLHLLLRTYTLGAQVLWQAMGEVARPGEESALVELGGALLSSQGRVIGAVTESYLDEQAALAAEHRERRRSLARALLNDTPHPDRPAPDTPVLVLRLEFTPRGALGSVAERRLVRRVQTELDRGFGGEVPALLDAGGGYAVVPGGAAVPDGLLAVLREVADPGVRLAVSLAPDPTGVPHASHVAAEIIRVARACGRPPGVHHLDDVLLEYHLSRPSDGSDRIAALLAPLGDRPDLVETLRIHLEQRQDRRATARRLNLHPNSVDNRLARIAELTGLDLGSPRDAALALAALLLT